MNSKRVLQNYVRRASLPLNRVNIMAENTQRNMRRISEFRPRKNSYPLELIVLGTTKLVEKLHTGSEGLVSHPQREPVCKLDNSRKDLRKQSLNLILTPIPFPVMCKSSQQERGFTQQLETMLKIENRLIFLLSVRSLTCTL